MSDDAATEEVTVTCRWESTHRLEVPKGWRPPGNLSDWPSDLLEELVPDTAALVDGG